MKSPEEFILSLPANESAIANILHHEITSIPGVSCKIRFKMPFYDYHKWLCYVSPQKKGGIELCFINGLKIDPSEEFLKAKKRVMVSGITINNKTDMDISLIKALVLEAIEFEKTKEKTPNNKAAIKSKPTK